MSSNDPRMNAMTALAAEHHHAKCVHELHRRNKHKGKRRNTGKPAPSERRAICRNRKHIHTAVFVVGRRRSGVWTH